MNDVLLLAVLQSLDAGDVDTARGLADLAGDDAAIETLLSDDVTESVQGPKGPPPFPGAVFDTGRHRWVKPGGEEGQPHDSAPAGHLSEDELWQHRSKLNDAADEGIKGTSSRARWARNMAYRFFAGDEGAQVAKHIPVGSKFLGAGTEAIVFQSPDGDVYRVAFDDGGRPDIPEVLQAKSSVLVGEKTEKNIPVRVERLPLAKKVPKAMQAEAVQNLHASLSVRGYEWTDDKTDNIGIVNGQVKIIDPGNLTRAKNSDAG